MNRFLTSWKNKNEGGGPAGLEIGPGCWQTVRRYFMSTKVPRMGHKASLARKQTDDKLELRDHWKALARQFMKARRGLAGAAAQEFTAGYVEGFLPVYVLPGKVQGETWYVWFVFPGKGKAARVVNKLLPGVYVDHEGNVIEHPLEWTLILGTVTRIGNTPLLTPKMFH
jgi:hypothetical protein